MPNITTTSVIAKVQTILHDTTGIRWPDAELLGWLNDGQREIVLYKPNAYVKTATTALVSGTKQTLPSDGVQLIDVVRNVPGRAIRIAMREILDSITPNWHGAAAATEVVHYMYSMLNPKIYYVYPPNNGAGSVELVYGAAPNDATSNGTITVDDIYMTVLIDYMLYRAYSKDSEFSADPNRAAAHQQAYLASLGGKAKVEAAVNPNDNAPANPNIQPNTR